MTATKDIPFGQTEVACYVRTVCVYNGPKPERSKTLNKIVTNIQYKSTTTTPSIVSPTYCTRSYENMYKEFVKKATFYFAIIYIHVQRFTNLKILRSCLLIGMCL